MSPLQLDLLAPSAHAAPDGFTYRAGLIDAAEERALVARFRDLPFREFEFHGYLGKRRTVSYGLHYDFNDMKTKATDDIPDFLLPLRQRAAAFADVPAAALGHVLVTEYMPGAAIGWHRDRPVFGDVIGISFLSPCRFRFRRALSNPPARAREGRVGPRRASGWERTAVTLAPRSAYLLRGPARHEWQHSIPPADALRYSVTFRTVTS